ncbi:MAG TPA: SDR family oxidoreductase [Blastocatellia bacterium]|nr:SDR family oxidoreductase [Blastocatellia bacterium]
MNFGLEGRVAIVTAASRGLGKATAMELAAEGARVAMNARNEEQLQDTAAEIRSATGAQVLAVAGDVTNEADVNRLISETKNRFGSIDILVANAGGPPAGFFDDFDAQHFRDAVELNLISTINLCRVAVPHMRERRWGRIIAITSIAAKQPVENLILSNTARAGVLGFLKSLSQQIAADGITVNTVCPGYHLTERLKSLSTSIAQKEGVNVEEVYARWAASTPMKRIGDPREFGAVVAFLCSERASYLTGTVIQIDGGAYRALY